MPVEILFAVVVLGVVVPVVFWLGDESAGRAGWRRVAELRETISLGEGPFRGGSVDVSRTEVRRTRAPWWVTLLALTCYLPSGVAVMAALPWLLGVLVLFDRGTMHPGFDRAADAMLVLAYPFGCWAALRMGALGRALLSGDRARFTAALSRASWVELPLNGALLLGALALTLTYRNADGCALALAPLATLAQLAAVALTGHAQLDAASPEATTSAEQPLAAQA
jgi:signal transduction histidine kinase